MPLTVNDVYAKNQQFKEIIYTNDAMRLTLITVGAAIKRLETPDSGGMFENIVVTYEQDADYLNNTKFLGATVGPYAGRIDPPNFTINETAHNLDKNFIDRINLHSGTDNLAFKNFDLVEANEDRAVFIHRSTEADSTFPAPVSYTVIYKFNPDGFTITYTIHSKKNAIANLTNHTYFNLSGNLKEDVLNHTLKLPAEHYMELNEDYIGVEKRPVLGTPFDFTSHTPLKKGIRPLENSPQKGIDHPFFLKQGKIELYDSRSKRTLELTTDYDCMVVYTNNILTPHTFEGGIKDHDHQAVCLEAQHLPNDIHFESHPKSVLTGGETRERTITYRVGISQK